MSHVVGVVRIHEAEGETESTSHASRADAGIEVRHAGEAWW